MNQKAPSNALTTFLLRTLPRFRAKVVYDVGANSGETTEFFARFFADARILAFEPVESIYDQLTARFAYNERVQAFRLAFGAQDHMVQVTARPDWTMNRVHDGCKTHLPLEDVEMVRGDTFAVAQGTESIDYLKIDTEGHDLKVLVGFHAMLREQAIGLIEVEAGMTPKNGAHVPLGRVPWFPSGFRLRVVLSV